MADKKFTKKQEAQAIKGLIEAAWEKYGKKTDVSVTDFSDNYDLAEFQDEETRLQTAKELADASKDLTDKNYENDIHAGFEQKYSEDQINSAYEYSQNKGKISQLEQKIKSLDAEAKKIAKSSDSSMSPAERKKKVAEIQKQIGELNKEKQKLEAGKKIYDDMQKYVGKRYLEDVVNPLKDRATAISIELGTKLDVERLASGHATAEEIAQYQKFLDKVSDEAIKLEEQLTADALNEFVASRTKSQSSVSEVITGKSNDGSKTVTEDIQAEQNKDLGDEISGKWKNSMNAEGEGGPGAEQILNFTIPQWGIADLINEREEFRKSVNSIRNEPGWFYFKIFFKFNTEYGLLGGVLNNMYDTAYQQTNTALLYLLNLRNLYQQERVYDRISALYKFVTLLSYINSKAPWFFKSIKGLAEAEKRSLDEFKVKSLEIGCDNDAVDMRLTNLVDLYKYVAFDYINCKEILPENLRKFDMDIFVFHMPIKYHQTAIFDNGAKVADYKTLNPDNNFEFGNTMSFKMYTFMNCEFDSQSVTISGDATNDKPFNISPNSLRINYDRCYMHLSNEYDQYMFGDDGFYSDSDSINIGQKFDFKVPKGEGPVMANGKKFGSTGFYGDNGTTHNKYNQRQTSLKKLYGIKNVFNSSGGNKNFKNIVDESEYVMGKLGIAFGDGNVMGNIYDSTSDGGVAPKTLQEKMAEWGIGDTSNATNNISIGDLGDELPWAEQAKEALKGKMAQWGWGYNNWDSALNYNEALYIDIDPDTKRRLTGAEWHKIDNRLNDLKNMHGTPKGGANFAKELLASKMKSWGVGPRSEKNVLDTTFFHGSGAANRFSSENYDPAWVTNDYYPKYTNASGLPNGGSSNAKAAFIEKMGNWNRGIFGKKNLLDETINAGDIQNRFFQGDQNIHGMPEGGDPLNRFFEKMNDWGKTNEIGMGNNLSTNTSIIHTDDGGRVSRTNEFGVPYFETEMEVISGNIMNDHGMPIGSGTKHLKEKMARWNMDINNPNRATEQTLLERGSDGYIKRDSFGFIDGVTSEYAGENDHGMPSGGDAVYKFFKKMNEWGKGNDAGSPDFDVKSTKFIVDTDDGYRGFETDNYKAPVNNHNMPNANGSELIADKVAKWGVGPESEKSVTQTSMIKDGETGYVDYKTGRYSPSPNKHGMPTGSGTNNFAQKMEEWGIGQSGIRNNVTQTLITAGEDATTTKNYNTIGNNHNMPIGSGMNNFADKVADMGVGPEADYGVKEILIDSGEGALSIKSKRYQSAPNNHNMPTGSGMEIISDKVADMGVGPEADKSLKMTVINTEHGFSATSGKFRSTPNNHGMPTENGVELLAEKIEKWNVKK